MGACSFLVKAETRASAMPHRLPTYGDLNNSSIKLIVPAVLVPFLDAKDITTTKSAGSVANLCNKCDYLCIDSILSRPSMQCFHT
jgi:hypothetical protein